MRMNELFKNAADQAAINRSGYSRFPYLSEREVADLHAFYKAETDEGDLSGFHASMFNEDPMYRKGMDERIRSVLQQRFNEFFRGEYELLYANFMVKEPGVDSEMKIHQDWSYVDENGADSFAIWIPLQDLTTKNGALEVYPGSHNSKNYARGPGVTCPFFDEWDQIKTRYMKPLYLQQGEAVIWNHRLAHYSPPNLTEQPRIAITAIIVPKSEKVYHYYKESSSSPVEQYEVDKDFYMNYNIASKPQARYVKDVVDDSHILNKEELDRLFVNTDKVMEDDSKGIIRKPSRRIFHEDTLEDEFNEEGFVTLDLLDSDKFSDLIKMVNELKSTSDSKNVNMQSEYELSFFNKDAEYRKKVVREVYAFFKPLLDGILDNYEPLIVNLFNKKPGSGEIPVHQNWTFIDESIYTSISVWIPLCDVEHKNGTMEVVPKTHNRMSNYRSPTIPWIFEGLQEVLKDKYLQPLELVKGQIAILDDAIIHWTSENNSEYDRPTIQLIMKPKEAVPLHYYCENFGKGEISVYQVDSDFFSTFEMFTRPAGVPIMAKDHHKYERINELELIDRIS